MRGEKIMEMLNERAIRIIEEIPIETDEQKAALELATEALKMFKCIELAYFQKNADFSEYKPTCGAVLRQMDNETLAYQIYDLSDAVKTCGYTEQEAVRTIFKVLESNFDEECKL